MTDSHKSQSETLAAGGGRETDLADRVDARLGAHRAAGARQAGARGTSTRGARVRDF
jgi:hypothetical protein